VRGLARVLTSTNSLQCLHSPLNLEILYDIIALVYPPVDSVNTTGDTYAS